MNRELELRSGGILKALAHVLNGKVFHVIVKKNLWIYVLMATHSEMKDCMKIVQNIWRCPYKGVSVWRPANGRRKKYVYSKFYAINWMSLLPLLCFSAGVTYSWISHRWSLCTGSFSSLTYSACFPFLSSASLKLIKATSFTVLLIFLLSNLQSWRSLTLLFLITLKWRLQIKDIPMTISSNESQIIHMPVSLINSLGIHHEDD